MNGVCSGTDASKRGPVARVRSWNDPVPRMTGVSELKSRSRTTSVTEAKATARRRVRKAWVVDEPAATATRPAAPAVRALDPVQIDQRRYGRRKSTSKPAAPTIIAASGPSVTPAKMKTRDDIETSIPSPLGPAGV